MDPEAALAVVGARAVGCADHARASGRDAPPYALCHFGADFFYIVSETPFCQGALGIPMAHLSLFSGPSVGHVAHIPLEPLSLYGGGGPLGEALVSRLGHTHPDGAFGAVRAVHGRSLRSIVGALVAPPSSASSCRFWGVSRISAL